MSLEAQLEALNKNVLALIGVMSNHVSQAPAPVKAGHADPAVIKPAEKAIEQRTAQAPAKAQEPAQEASAAPAVTYAMVKAQIAATSLAKGRDVVVQTLTELGYPSGVKALETSGTPEQLAPILEALKKAAA